MNDNSDILKRKQLALESILKNDDVLFILGMLIEDSGIFRTTYIPNDSHGSAFREGVRYNGLQILGLFDNYQDAYFRMLKILKVEQ